MAAPGAKTPRNVLELAWQRYLASLQDHPVTTKALTSAGLGALSDVLAQGLVGQPYDWRRTLAVSLFGLLWTGPAGHLWHSRLERAFRGRRDANSVLLKVLLDNLTFGPLTNALALLYLGFIVEGRSWTDARARLAQQFLGVQAVGWRLWPLISVVNHRYVPPQLRVLTTSVAALFWSSFLILRSRSVTQLTK